MKKCYMKAFALLLAVAGLQTGVMAQNRKIDLEVKLTSPAVNAVIANGQQFDVAITIKNIGPDTLKATDSIAFVHSGMQQNQVSLAVFSNMNGGNALPPGATTAPVVIAQLTNNSTETTDQTADFCAQVLDINGSNLQLQGGGTLTVSWDDAVTTNNESCASITIKGKPAGTGIFDIAKDNEALVMGPNPASNEVTFRLNLATASALTASVKDIQGREVLKQDFGRVASGNNISLKLDISTLKNGIYFVELNGGDKKSVGKLVVQR